jgi:predicted 3-demethylubiquinone-9 3-methyltransferase (glyoxalase superfamily)
MTANVTTFLMFEGKAEEAMTFYVSLFPNSSITSRELYGPEGPGIEGSVKRASFSLNGRPLMCIDSPVKHNFTFTPAVSLFVDCEAESEVDALFARLSEGGAVLMPLGPYPFARKFGWVADKYGVSWQLYLASAA